MFVAQGMERNIQIIERKFQTLLLWRELSCFFKNIHTTTKKIHKQNFYCYFIKRRKEKSISNNWASLTKKIEKKWNYEKNIICLKKSNFSVNFYEYMIMLEIQQ